jgi:hypothetical protein
MPHHLRRAAAPARAASPRLRSQSCNSASQPVGTTIAKTNQTTTTDSAKGDRGGGASSITGHTPMNAAVAQVVATTAFLLTDSRAGPGGQGLAGRSGMPAVRAARSA